VLSNVENAVRHECWWDWLVFLLSHSVARVAAVALDAAYPVLDGFLIMLSVMILVFFRSRFYLWGYVSFGLGFSMLTKPEAFWRD